MRRTLNDLAALAARLGIGGIFFANGWHKLEAGLTITGQSFAQQGAPAPGAWAAVTMLTELIGGALLVAGLAVPIMGIVLFVDTLAVFLVARPLNPIDTNLVVALGAAAVLLAVVGAGRISVDHLVVIRRRDAEAAGEFAADNEADAAIAAMREPTTDPGSTTESMSESPPASTATTPPASAPTPAQISRDEPTAASARSDRPLDLTDTDLLVAGEKKSRSRSRKTPE